jgi:ArsR family metal-binding transcriptional regulator
MLIKVYYLEVTTPPCGPAAERFNAIARLAESISQVLPYLNANWRGAIYYPEACFLTWHIGGRAVIVRPHEIVVSQLEDREDAVLIIDRLVGMINHTWERRYEITPSWGIRHRPTPMEVYKQLPQTNCRECGEPTCYIFALKLVTSQLALEDCPLLFDSKYADQLTALSEIMADTFALGEIGAVLEKNKTNQAERNSVHYSTYR